VSSYNLERLNQSNWMIGAEAFSTIRDQILCNGDPERILEFGSGESTRAFSCLFPHAQIESYDHDPRWMVQFQHGEGNNVRVCVDQLRRRVIDGLLCETYAGTPAPAAFDVVLVDGPPGTTPNGRLGALLLGYRALRVGGLMFLDDARRPSELRTIADFVERTRTDLTFIQAGHGVAMFRKKEEGIGPTPKSLVLQTAASFGQQRLKQALRRRR